MSTRKNNSPNLNITEEYHALYARIHPKNKIWIDSQCKKKKVSIGKFMDDLLSELRFAGKKKPN